MDKLCPWTSQPFGRRTQSQNSYIKCRTKQEEYIGCKKQEQHRQVILTGAIQTVIAAQNPTQLTRLYAEYHAEPQQPVLEVYEDPITEQNDAEAQQEQALEQQEPPESPQMEQQHPSQTNPVATDSEVNTAPMVHPCNVKCLQFVDMEGRPSDYHLQQAQTTLSPGCLHYYYPHVPPIPFRRGDAGKCQILHEWLEGNTTITDADFW